MRRQLLLVLGLIHAFPGCVVSLHPLYEGAADLSPVDPYVGNWKSERYLVRIETAPEMEGVPSPRMSIGILESPDFGNLAGRRSLSPRKSAWGVGRIVEIGDHTYLDFTALPPVHAAPEVAPMYWSLVIRARAIARVELQAETMTLRLLDPEKLKTFVKEHPTALSMLPPRNPEHELEQIQPTAVLTASSKQLKRVLAEHADADLWMDDPLVLSKSDGKAFDAASRKLARRLAAAEKERTRDATPLPPLVLPEFVKPPVDDSRTLPDSR